MRALPFAWSLWDRLQPRYAAALCAFPLASSFAMFVPLYFFAQWSSAALGIAPEAAVREHPSGAAWFFLFMAVMVLALFAGYLAGFVLEALFCRAVLRWPRDEVERVFLRSELPGHWFRH